MNSHTRYRIGILVSVIGFSLWLYVISSTTVSWIDTSYEFGLFQQLPVFYGISLLTFVAGILLLLEHQSKGIFLLQIVVLGMMIWGTPVFVENNARSTDTWWHLGTTKTILDSGRITVNSSATHKYLEWPGSFVFSSIVISVLGLPPESYIRIFPLLSSTVLILAYYVWIQKIVENKIVQKLSIIALFFLNLWLQFHASPQGFGLMLFPLVLTGLMNTTIKWRLIAVVLYLSLVISHPLTPFFIVLLSIAEIVLLSMRKKVTKPVVVFFLISVWLAWFVFNASWSFDIRILEVSTGIQNFGETLGTTKALVETKTSYVPSLIRLITIACAMAVAILYIFRSRKQECTRRFPLYAGWIISFFLFFSYDLILYSSLQDRAFMFAFLLVPPLLVESAWKLTNVRIDMRITAGILLLLLFPNLLTLYYSENLSIVSDSNIEMVLHLNKYFSQGAVYGIKRCDVIYAFNTSYDYASLYYQRNKLPVNSFIVFDEFTMQTPGALGGSNMRYFYNICSERIGANLLYSSDKFQVYYTDPPT